MSFKLDFAFFPIGHHTLKEQEKLWAMMVVTHVTKLMRKRAPWIRRQVRFFSQFQPRTPERQYLSGETHLYLGRQYKLKVVPDIQQRVKLYQGALVVQSLKPRQTDITKALVRNGITSGRTSNFGERLAECQKRFSKPDNYEPSGLIVRQLAQRGRLILNRSLIRLPSITLLPISLQLQDFWENLSFRNYADYALTKEFTEV